ncbi:MAG: serine/threonine-protein kinase [Gemmatimonadales bacterium]
MADKLVDDLKRALGDAYTIERELTGGGMSRVFVAKEHALGREVVIKVLPPELAAGVNRERFRREVQLAARLSHPYIVPLLHAGEHGELLWFTMPYIHGDSLRTLLQKDGPLEVADAVKLLRDVVEALAYAHSRGVVHRDIKPANIMYDGSHAVVTDFGVAKALNAALPNAGPGHTTSGMAIGTPAYMAPEQLAADPDADQRVDIYAAGLLAYELLSGASPFAAPSPTATMTAQLTRVPEPLHVLRADVPPAFSELVQRCLAKSPDDRPRDAQAVLAELDRISGALAAAAHHGAHDAVPARPRAASLPLVFATVGVLALVAGGFWWSQRNGAKPAPSTANPAARPGTDTGDLGAPLPTRPMTHADSLQLLAALQSQLRQVDPKYRHRPVPKPAVPESVELAVKTREIDSLIRDEFRAITIQRSMSGNRPPDAVPPARPPTSVTVTPIAPALPSAGIANAVTPRRLLILLPRERGTDSTMRTLQLAAAAELAGRSNRFGQWTSVMIDSAGQANLREVLTAGSADVLAYIVLHREPGDSVRLQVSIRNVTPGASFGYRMINSDPVYHPTGIQAFNGALRDAARLLGQLRQLGPGQVWSQDMGGPYAAPGYTGPRVSTFSPKVMDSLHRIMDSMQAHFRKRRDSMPQRRDSI